VTALQSVAILRPAPRPIEDGEVATDCQWRAVCEYPGRTPAEMAVQAGKAAFAAADARVEHVQWLVHAGVGPQGSQGWPVHHHIQNGIVGCHGNALELKQNCAGGLTSWLLGARLLDDKTGYSICTGADNWSWSDRFANAKTGGGEPFSDVAHASVISYGGGFAKLMGSGTASCPDLADDWRVHETFWENTNADDFQRAYARATARSLDSIRESLRMFMRAIRAALADAKLSPQYVTHFVPQGSDSGQPFRSLANLTGLPWSNELHQHNLDHGYLGVSTHADGLLFLAQTGSLRSDSIVMLLAAEYELSATAVVLQVVRPPRVSADGVIQVIT
jgi:3-oxoacyl-[acyl-carrier-protein] synthase III